MGSDQVGLVQVEPTRRQDEQVALPVEGKEDLDRTLGGLVDLQCLRRDPDVAQNPLDQNQQPLLIAQELPTHLGAGQDLLHHLLRDGVPADEALEGLLRGLVDCCPIRHSQDLLAGPAAQDGEILGDQLQLLEGADALFGVLTVVGLDLVEEDRPRLLDALQQDPRLVVQQDPRRLELIRRHAGRGWPGLFDHQGALGFQADPVFDGTVSLHHRIPDILEEPGKIPMGLATDRARLQDPFLRQGLEVQDDARLRQEDLAQIHGRVRLGKGQGIGFCIESQPLEVLQPNPVQQGLIPCLEALLDL